MALIKKETVDKIEVVNAHDIPMVQVRKVTWIEDDETGQVVGGKSYHRHVVTPDDDASDEVEVVRGIANAVHTPAVKARHQARKAEQANGGA